MKQFTLESECLWALLLLLLVRFHDRLIEAETIEVDCKLFRDISVIALVVNRIKVGK